MPQRYRGRGGGILYRDYFARETFAGGTSPPLELPKLQLPHAQPNVQAHAPFTICTSKCH